MVKTQLCDNRSCNEKVEVSDDFEHEYCCAGRMEDMCGCYGLPINPIFCDTCEQKIFGKSVDKQNE